MVGAMFAASPAAVAVVRSSQVPHSARDLSARRSPAVSGPVASRTVGDVQAEDRALDGRPPSLLTLRAEQGESLTVIVRARTD